MSTPIILATDLDRTLLPNGHEFYDGSLPQLFNLVHQYNFLLVYVTGRSIDLFYEAQDTYGIETPAYLLADVGSTLYVAQQGLLVEDEVWATHLRQHTKRWDVAAFIDALKPTALRLQEPEKQKEFKLSFYCDEPTQTAAKAADVESVLHDKLQVEARVVHSIDPLTNQGLVDILPEAATKVGALEFLREKLGVTKDQVVYCGDSGNDVLPLSNGYRSIAVHNIHEAAWQEVVQRNTERGFQKQLYRATGTLIPQLNGNYSSGVIEGLVHFGLVDQESLL